MFDDTYKLCFYRYQLQLQTKDGNTDNSKKMENKLYNDSNHEKKRRSVNKLKK